MATAASAIKYVSKARRIQKNSASHIFGILFVCLKVKTTPEFPPANLFLYFFGQNCVTLPVQIEWARERGLVSIVG